MFKTIYSKYLSSFILLLGLGFIAIALVMSSVVTSYSINDKADIMDKSAKMIYASIKKEMDSSGFGFNEVMQESFNDESNLFEALSEFSDSQVIIIDGVGNVLFQSSEETIKAERISSKTLENIRKDSGNAKLSTLNSTFENARFNYIYTIEFETDSGENELMGYIILSSSSTVLKDAYEQIIKVLIVASLWVFLAAIIIVYFITDRITTPIKQMSKAVEAYSKGDFKARIPVKGSDEIATLSEAFNKMAGDMEKLETTRANFLSSVSHDLKTPMTSIRGFIEGILDGTIPYEKQEYYLGVILEEVKRLTRLVNTLLDVSRMESGAFKLNPSYFDVCEIARLIIISFEEKIDEKNINIEFEIVDDPSKVYADKDAVYQVIYNLVGNAMKFTDENGTIRIEVLPVKGQNKYSVSVYNTGIGIQEKDIPYLFDRFYKSDSSRGLDKTGTGLGLYIAKTKLEAHGEKISVDSKYGEYCKFTFTLSDNNKELDRLLFKK